MMGTTILVSAGIVAAASIAAGPLIHAAEDYDAASELSNLVTVEQVALAYDGAYTDDLGSLRDGTYGLQAKPSKIVKALVRIDPKTGNCILTTISVTGHRYTRTLTQ